MLNDIPNPMECVAYHAIEGVQVEVFWKARWIQLTTRCFCVVIKVTVPWITRTKAFYPVIKRKVKRIWFHSRSQNKSVIDRQQGVRIRNWCYPWFIYAEPYNILCVSCLEIIPKAWFILFFVGVVLIQIIISWIIFLLGLRNNRVACEIEFVSIVIHI